MGSGKPMALERCNAIEEKIIELAYEISDLWHHADRLAKELQANIETYDQTGLATPASEAVESWNKSKFYDKIYLKTVTLIRPYS